MIFPKKKLSYLLKFNSLITGLVSLIINSVILIDYRNSPFAKFLLWDAANYWEWALDISSGNWIGNAIFHQAPFYPYLLSVFISIFGENIFVIYTFQCLLSAITSVMICSITNYLTENKISGLAAGLIYSFYGMQAFYTTKILTECISAFFSVFFVWLIFSEKVKRKEIVAGITFGILLLIKPHFLISVPFIILFYFLEYKKQGYRIVFKKCCFFISPVILIISLVTARNYHVGNDFVLVSSNGGENFYIGNHKKANGTYIKIEGVSADIAYQDKDISDLARKKSGKEMNRSEISKYWFKSGLSFIKNNKLKYIRLQWKKFKNLFSGADLTNMYIMSFEEKNITNSFSLAFVNIYMLFPMFCAGIFPVMIKWKKYFLVILMFFVNIANIMIFFYDTRFMVITMPFFVIICIIGIKEIINIVKRTESIKTKFYQPVIIASIAGICLLPVIIKRDNRFESQNWRMWMTLGEINYGLCNYKNALKYYVKSSEMKKTEPMPAFGVSKTLFKMGQKELAVKIFKSTFEKSGPEDKKNIMRDRDFDSLRVN